MYMVDSVTELSKVTSILKITPPYDFVKTLQFLNDFSITNEPTIDMKYIFKAIQINSRIYLVNIESIGTIRQPALKISIYSESQIEPDLQEYIIQRISAFLGLDDNVLPFYNLAVNDPIFSTIITKLYGYHHTRFLTPHESACWAVLTAQNHITTAKNIWESLIKAYGGGIIVNNRTYYAFPEPIDLVEADKNELSIIIGNNRKMEYLLSVTNSFMNIDEWWLRTANYNDVYNWLLKIKGIGPWSAFYIMSKGLGRTEEISLSNKELVTISAKYYNHKPIKEEMLKIASQYEKYQGYWAIYLKQASLFDEI